MSSDWRDTTLGEFMRLQRGHDLTATEQKSGKVPIMGSAGPNGTHSTARASGPGVVIGRSGGSAGRVHFSEVDYWPHNTCLYVTDFLGNNPRYCYYLLQTLNLASFNSGSAQASINRNFLYPIKLRVPERPVQDRIAGLLQLIDHSITLARQTNSALESVAQALFRSWFVNFDPVHAKAAGNAPEAMSAEIAALFPSEFEDSALGAIPKGWSAGVLRDVATNPRAQAKPSAIPSNTPYVGLEHMPRRSLSLTRWGTSDDLESGKFWFKHNDVLFGKLRPYFHKVGLAPTAGVCSTDILVVRPISENWLGFLTMLLFSDAFILNATQLSDGARMPRTNWKDAAAYEIPVPSIELATRFNQHVMPLFKVMHTNIAVIQTLASLRDHLLPRLISGKLSIGEAEEAVAALVPELAEAT